MDLLMRSSRYFFLGGGLGIVSSPLRLLVLATFFFFFLFLGLLGRDVLYVCVVAGDMFLFVSVICFSCFIVCVMPFSSLICSFTS